jgi:hypothetical protein
MFRCEAPTEIGQPAPAWSIATAFSRNPAWTYAAATRTRATLRTSFQARLPRLDAARSGSAPQGYRLAARLQEQDALGIMTQAFGLGEISWGVWLATGDIRKTELQPFLVPIDRQVDCCRSR